MRHAAAYGSNLMPDSQRRRTYCGCSRFGAVLPIGHGGQFTSQAQTMWSTGAGKPIPCSAILVAGSTASPSARPPGKRD